MSFHPISNARGTWNGADKGRYIKSGSTFSGPADEFKISAGRAAKSGLTSAAITRRIQKDITTGSTVERRQMIVTLQLQVPVGFSSAEIDNAIADISDFATTSTLDSMLMGES